MWFTCIKIYNVFCIKHFLQNANTNMNQKEYLDRCPGAVRPQTFHFLYFNTVQKRGDFERCSSNKINKH